MSKNNFFTSREEKEFLEKNKNIPDYSEINTLYKNKKISKEELVKLTKTREKFDRISIDKEYKDVRNKEYLKAAVDIGTAAIPIGGGAKLTAVAAKSLTPYLGKKIAQTSVNGVIQGTKYGALHGTLSGLVEGKNPIKEGGKEALEGALTGGVISFGIGKAVEKAAGNKLKEYGDIDKLSQEKRKEYRQVAKRYYKDYIQETKLNRDGKIDFSGRGSDENLTWNPKQGQNFPELKRDIKNAKRLPDRINVKAEKKPNIDHYEVYRGKNGDHLIEVFKKDKSGTSQKRYYFTSDTPGGPSRDTIPDSTEGITSMIHDKINNFNSTKVLDILNNKSVQNTAENIVPKISEFIAFKRSEKNKKQNKTSFNTDNIIYNGKKWSDWSIKSKKAFMEGFETGGRTKNPSKKNTKNSIKNKANIETNNNKDRSGKINFKNTKSMEGHWVTLDNGRHVLIED